MRAFDWNAEKHRTVRRGIKGFPPTRTVSKGSKSHCDSAVVMRALVEPRSVEPRSCLLELDLSHERARACDINAAPVVTAPTFKPALAARQHDVCLTAPPRMVGLMVDPAARTSNKPKVAAP